MSPTTTSGLARVLAGAGIAIAFAVVPPIAIAPVSNADSSDLELCSGDQTPEEDNCRTPCPDNAPMTSQGTCAEPGTQDITGGPADDLNIGAPGANPEVPDGTDPDHVIYGPSEQG
jgi:hypothetical protein